MLQKHTRERQYKVLRLHTVCFRALKYLNCLNFFLFEINIFKK
jgi:hypothetical protein